jgi:hypothetical protein
MSNATDSTNTQDRDAQSRCALSHGSARGRPKIPDGTKRDGYVRVMGKWVWAGPKQPREKRARKTPKKRGPRVDRTIYVTVFCPKVPCLRDDEEHTRTLNLATWRDRDWLIFMQENYAYLRGDLPTLFPQLNK